MKLGDGMKSLADNLPPEFAALVHPDWRKYEADYWSVRDQLLEQYRDQWVGFAAGAVIATGETAAYVVDAAEAIAQHAFIARVGREQEPEMTRRGFRWPSGTMPAIKSLADLLPPEIAAQLHPELRKNEADYWKLRDTIFQRYDGQWIGFAGGEVVASGRSPVQVLHAAQKTGLHPHVTCVGHEFEPDRIRRATFPYDVNYPRDPLPLIEIEFRSSSGVPGVLLDRVIPDTGADSSTLPWGDCQLLNLNFAKGILSTFGAGGTAKGTVLFEVWVQLDGKEYECRVHADLSGTERILGRDVLNQLEILFRGPANEVVVNP